MVDNMKNTFNNILNTSLKTSEFTNNFKPQILTLSEVIKLTTLSRSTIYRMIKAGTFPTPISLSQSRSGFIATEVGDWIHSRARVDVIQS